ncbi:ABC-type Fe3+-siderophore transport system permease subunit [Hymenobacter luteus]|uniref:ABC-type Fe3+-siderophore transport system permease subunit n=2 Tax=Hymenobacter TaxID=89966 RepID=A0A7W9WDT8_9BACT|nr:MULTISPECIES: DUF4199 domain-containing protein [Hymenobacter]MBB4602998.1 ABC-type Fe3+-siderophore transport system permease subunit [Hymenobacter latericoloratus]MBB6060890.1 ABC-type Fe3+-siderophore transport system permease subunit [Hymenobacter luteus]
MENTSTPAVTPTAVGIRFGLITGVALTVLSFIQLAFISDPETPFRWLGALVGIAGIVLAHKSFKQLNRGFMSYGQGLGIGTILSAVAGAVSSLFSYIYINFIDPDYMSRVMEITRTRMEDKGMDDAQIDQAMAWAEKFSSGPITIVFGLLMSVFMGFLVSLIISAFTKNARPEFE